MKFERNWMLVIGPLAAAALGIGLGIGGLKAPACWCAAVTLLCGIWWICEVIPLAATALIPFAVFPMVGILSHREVAGAYGHTLILLMLTGSIISTAMEKSGAHRRVAIGMVRIVGGNGGRRLVLGFLLASAVLSMWVSNTATVVMLLPVAIAVLEGLDDREKLAVPLLLAVAYGAAVGGSGTPVGTPANLILINQYQETTGEEIVFHEWMKMGLPVVVLMLPVVWLWLTRNVSREAKKIALPDLGPWEPDQRRVLIVFGLTALAWITRKAPFGGWGSWIGAESTVGDSTVALIAALALFILPSGREDKSRLLDWQTANTIPWGVFIMIGGGMALGMGFKESNLSEALGIALKPVAGLPLILMILCLCLFATFFTEVASNTAVSNILMPIMAAVGTAAGIDPLLVMLPVTLGLNWSFMLPAATAPNAIIYGAGLIPLKRMAQEGCILNVIGSLLITIVCYFVRR